MSKQMPAALPWLHQWPEDLSEDAAGLNASITASLCRGRQTWIAVEIDLLEIWQACEKGSRQIAIQVGS